jgi:hypothetical protein
MMNLTIKANRPLWPKLQKKILREAGTIKNKKT